MSEREREQARTEEAGAEATSSGNPIKEMFLLAALYLPLGFFLWFFMASGLMFPTSRLVEWLLTGFYPDVFERVVQLGFRFEVQTAVILPQQVEGRTAALNLDINPMIYAWGLALLFGLVMATPMRGLRRLLQLIVGFVIVTLVTSWGVFWEVWRDMAFLMGPEAATAVQSSNLSATAIALCYQLGYLMFPGVIPIAAWILMNRPFIEQLVQSRPR
ncbi:exosortase H-associated membrane protein [Wenzhouxiangella sp. EGI_FJ10305]|uniref:exosortase H-associated membrane protein n=1 Tax=Wenzhouxiangella sp. EGI_FJ10305 TaxID=3243768 RepID=UPI0035D6B027